jgi:hypothetical protein
VRQDGEALKKGEGIGADEWWDSRRLRYNVALILAGAIAFVLYVWAFEVRCLDVPDAEISLFTTCFQAVGYAFAMALANVCYQLGPACERLVPKRHADSYRQISYASGFAISVAAPFSVPLMTAVWGCGG